MAFHHGGLEASLAAAVGDDTALIAELRLAFFDSARRLRVALGAADPGAATTEAARRLRNLAASFGASRLMEALNPVIEAGTLRAADARRIDRALALLGDS